MASNRNEYQELFPGGKSGRCVRLTTWPHSCGVVTKSGSLNLLAPSGPLQACNGTALPLQWCVSQTQQNFIMFNYCNRATCFDSYRIILRPFFLEGSADDSVRIETCRPNTIINIIKFCSVWLTHHCIFIYVLNTSGRQTLNKRTVVIKRFGGNELT